MDRTAIQTSTVDELKLSLAGNAREDITPFCGRFGSARETTLELGLWLISLESFFTVGNHIFAEDAGAKAATRDWSREFRLTHSSLFICSKLIFELEKALGEELKFAGDGDENSLVLQQIRADVGEIRNLSLILKDALLLNAGLLRGAPLNFGEWRAWSNSLSGKIKELPVFARLAANAEAESREFLPEIFRAFLSNKSLPLATESDLKLVLPRFAQILKWLSVVERMLENDEPLKPVLLLFSSIYEQIRQLIKLVDNRLRRFPNEEDKFFQALDGTAYTASIELRKVYEYELSGLAELRPPPSIFAKVETAYSLLNDSFQQTLIGFAQLLEPNIVPEEIFPNFQTKLKHSIVLRQDLWEILQSVQAAEKNPDKTEIDSLHGRLNEFLAATLHFLFYKDMETVERFIEEVLVTDNKKDLVPILHRFGAYLETLFGQVNMRTVLAKHPFDR